VLILALEVGIEGSSPSGATIISGISAILSL